MTDGVKIDTVRSGSSGVLGRSLNRALRPQRGGSLTSETRRSP